MKPIIHLFSLLFLASLMSCTEVIELDLNNSEPRYVIEANLNADSGMLEVLVTESGSFTDPGAYARVSNATIVLSDDEGNRWEATELAPGQYATENIQTAPGASLNLQVTIGDTEYLAATLVPEPVVVDSVVFVEVSGPQRVAGQSPVIFFQNQGSAEPFFQVKTRIGNSSPAFSVIPLENAIDGGRIALFQAVYDSGTPLTMEVRSVTESVYRYLSDVAALKGETVGPASAAPANPDDQWTNQALGYFSVWYADEVTAIVP